VGVDKLKNDCVRDNDQTIFLFDHMAAHSTFAHKY